jgi:hypothetical protein
MDGTVVDVGDLCVYVFVLCDSCVHAYARVYMCTCISEICDLYLSHVHICSCDIFVRGMHVSVFVRGICFCVVHFDNCVLVSRGFEPLAPLVVL